MRIITDASELPLTLDVETARAVADMGRRQFIRALNDGVFVGVKVAGRWKVPRDPLLRALGIIDDESSAEIVDGEVVDLGERRLAR